MREEKQAEERRKAEQLSSVAETSKSLQDNPSSIVHKIEELNIKASSSIS